MGQGSKVTCFCCVVMEVSQKLHPDAKVTLHVKTLKNSRIISSFAIGRRGTNECRKSKRNRTTKGFCTLYYKQLYNHHTLSSCLPSGGLCPPTTSVSPLVRLSLPRGNSKFVLLVELAKSNLAAKETLRVHGAKVLQGLW